MKTLARYLGVSQQAWASSRFTSLPAILILVFAALVALPLHAQEDQPTNPRVEGSDAGKQAKPSVVSDNPKNDRIFKVIPNYTTVENPTDFARISVKEKFKLGAEDSFDPYEIPLAGIVALKAQASDDDASWGQGMKGYGKRYAAAFADTTIGSFMTTGVFPSLLKEDPRYFRKADGTFLHRTGYALKRIFVIHTDSDHSQFNFSELARNWRFLKLSF